MIREVIKSGLLLVLVIILTTCSKGYVNYYSNKTCVIKAIKKNDKLSAKSTVNGKNQITKFEVYDDSGKLENIKNYEYNTDGKIIKTTCEEKKTKGKYYVTYEYTGNNLTKTYYFNYDTLSGNFSEVSYHIYYYNKTKITKIETYGIKDTIPSKVYSFITNSEGNITTFTTKENSRTTVMHYSDYDHSPNPYKDIMIFNYNIGVAFFNNNNPGSFLADGAAFELNYIYNYNNYPAMIKFRHLNNSASTLNSTTELGYYCQ